jgi:hypothetical protein
MAFLFSFFGNSMLKEKMTELKQVIASQRLKPSTNFPMIHLQEGYEIEKVVEGLTYPTSVAWDERYTF